MNNHFFYYLVLIFIAGGFLRPAGVSAGEMYLEHRGELARGYTFFRGVFDLGDIDHDGADEMIIADDEGGFHVYRFTRSGFVPIWINDPVIEDGHIVAVEIINEGMVGIRPQIMLLDSVGTLHQVQYTGYLFEETATYKDYREPGESGRLVVTDIAGGAGTRAVYIALANPPDDEITVENPVETVMEDESDRWSGMTLYRLTSAGLIELTDSEMAELEDGEVYFIRELTQSDVDELETLGIHAVDTHPGYSYESDRIGLVDLDRDALLELLISVSDPTRPVDRLEIYNEESGVFTVRVTLELPLLNEMVLGDIDGDGFREIVGLTFDGEVLVYQYDPLTLRYTDGTEINWDNPHKIIDETIWVSLSGFKGLGCITIEEPGLLRVIYNEIVVTLDTGNGIIKCGDEILLPEIPIDAVEDVPYLPLLVVLDCLGFHYEYFPEQDVVEVELEE